jgi:hypothetical protein
MRKGVQRTSNHRDPESGGRNKFMSLQEERFLGYGYRSPSDYESVKKFSVSSFAERGWQLTRQKDDGWSQSFQLRT